MTRLFLPMPGSQSMMIFLRVGCLLSLAPATVSMLTLPTPLPTPFSLTAAISSATLTRAETTGNQQLKASRNRKNSRRIPGEIETLQLLLFARSGVLDRSVASDAQLGRTLTHPKTSFWGQGPPETIRTIGRRPMRKRNVLV